MTRKRHAMQEKTGVNSLTTFQSAVLRNKTGLGTYHFPTAAQREYACRTGTTAPLYSGTRLTHTNSGAKAALLARGKYSSFLANATLMDRNIGSPTGRPRSARTCLTPGGSTT